MFPNMGSQGILRPSGLGADFVSWSCPTAMPPDPSNTSEDLKTKKKQFKEEEKVHALILADKNSL